MKHFAAYALAVLAATGWADAKPRAVSLDYCSDQYLLKLADPDQIAAVSRGGDDDYSFMRDTAAPFPKIRPEIQEASALEPDLVLRQWGGGPAAATSFARFGADVVSLGYANDFDDVKANIRMAAKALQQNPRGEALIADLEKRLSVLAARPDTNIRALYVTPGGVTAGAQTMIDAIMNAAGVVNIAAAEGKSYWPPLPAEQLILAPPELVVAGFFDTDAEQINHWSAARHPALRKMMQETPSIRLSADLLSCGAWYSVDAAEQLAAAAEAIRHEK